MCRWVEKEMKWLAWKRRSRSKSTYPHNWKHLRKLLGKQSKYTVAVSILCKVTYSEEKRDALLAWVLGQFGQAHVGEKEKIKKNELAFGPFV